MQLVRAIASPQTGAATASDAVLGLRGSVAK